MKKYNTILSIAGSDSIGGAGIQADIKTSCALGVYAMTAITAVTAQNTMKVNSWRSVGAEMLKAQIKAVCEDVTPDALKIGMVPDAESSRVIVEAIKEYNLKNIILDPVMVATTGSSLSDASAMEVLCHEAFPLADLVTPNIPEAKVLLQGEVSSTNTEEWSALISEKWRCKNVLVKGGHGENSILIDYLWHDYKNFKFSHPAIETKNTHGTGCSLSTAIACGLAIGKSMLTAVNDAIAWLQQAIQSGSQYSFGNGHGPVNHLANFHS